MKQPAMYLLASQRNGTLYTGVTSDVVQWVWQHKHGVTGGFTQAHQAHQAHQVQSLVYVEQHADMLSAITREKQIKKWQQTWKVALIEQANPSWRDLWGDVPG